MEQCEKLSYVKYWIMPWKFVHWRPRFLYEKLKVLFYCTEALELIQLLMEYEVRSVILEGLVRLLRPSTDDVQQQLDMLNGQC